jgi:hypothetical protein
MSPVFKEPERRYLHHTFAELEVRDNGRIFKCTLNLDLARRCASGMCPYKAAADKTRITR